MSDENNQNGEITLEKLQADLDSTTNNWKRALADFENYKRRKETENKELIEFAKEVTVVKLLPIIDSLEQALRHMPVYMNHEAPVVDRPRPDTTGQAGSMNQETHPHLTSPIKGEENVDSLPSVGRVREGGEEFASKYQNLPPSSPSPLTGEGGGEGDFSKLYQNWQKGIEVLLAQLDKTLAELGVQKIEALGKKFDPNFHEAVREVESDEDGGMVVEELQSGFELNGKVIRPSQVVISKKN